MSPAGWDSRISPSSPKPRANPETMTAQDRRNEDSAVGVYRRLIGYASEYKLIFVLAMLAMLIGALGEGATAWLMKPLLDQGFVERDASVIRLIPIGVLVIALVRGLGTFGSSYA